MDDDHQSTWLEAEKFAKRVQQARDQILDYRLLQPEIAIILGSGLGGLADCVQHPSSIAYSEIPGFPPTSAAGHAGRLILGFLAGLPVVVMQGRAHRYEGWSNSQVQFPVHCMHALGARTLIATNAAGGLNPRYRQGDLMAIDGHIDFLWARQQRTASAEAVRGIQPYDLDAIDRSQQIARVHNTCLHRGTYIGTLGPTYETRNEYRMFRELGGDAVGMSTIPEIRAARGLMMRTIAYSVITNVASTDVPQSTNHAEVVDSGNQAGPKLMRIILGLLESWSGEPD